MKTEEQHGDAPWTRFGCSPFMSALCRAVMLLCVFVPAISTAVGSNQGLSIEIAGDEHATGESFEVRIRNNGSKDLGFCMSLYGSIIRDDDTSRAAPAFEVQTLTEGKWGDLIWICDVGNNVAPNTLEAGKALVFRIRLNAPGTYRLRLNYEEDKADGSNRECALPNGGKSMKRAISKEFKVVEKTE